MGTILVVDDDASLRNALRHRLEFWGHDVFEAEDGNAALLQCEKREFDLVLLDLAMPGLDGQSVLEDETRLILVNARAYQTILDDIRSKLGFPAVMGGSSG